MRPGRHLVAQHLAGGRHEHFDRQQADEVQRLGGACCDADGGLDGLRRHARGDRRGRQDMVGVVVLGGLKAHHLAVLSAGPQNRDLALEIDERLEHGEAIVPRGLAARHSRPGRVRVTRRFHLGLTLAVIAKARGLEHGRRPGNLNGGL